LTVRQFHDAITIVDSGDNVMAEVLFTVSSVIAFIGVGMLVIRLCRDLVIDIRKGL
jgi:hypothetical protein